MNNAEFVQRLRDQDPEAAKHLADCFVPTVWRFVYGRVHGDRHLAEDIVSESVLAFVAAISQGVDIESPSAWLCCVARRRMQDHFRAAARVQHLMQQAGSTMHTDVQQTPATEHDRKLQQEEVRLAIDRLSEPHRLALEWKYIDRISVREIAQRLGTTEKGAESILFRARNHLRAELQTQERTQPPATPSQPARACDDEDEHHRSPCPNEMTRTWS